MEISGETDEDLAEYLAVKTFVLPSLKISYPIYKNFTVAAQAGYLFDLGGKYICRVIKIINLPSKFSGVVIAFPLD